MKRALLLIGLSFFFATCVKVNTPKCEVWEVTDEKNYLGSGIDWSCAGKRTYQLVFCGDALKDARPGNTKVIGGGDCQTTRTFVRFIRIF